MSRLSLLVDLAALLARQVDLDTLLGTACRRVAEALAADRATIWLVDAERGNLVMRVAELPELSELRQPIDRGIAGHVARTGETVRLDEASSDPRFDPTVDRTTGYVSRSMLVAPIREQASGPVRGVLQLLNKQGGPFDDDDAQYLEALGLQLAQALTLTTLRAQDASEPGVVLRGRYNHVIGRSAAMQEVYRKIELAAKTDATLLLRGETGTGKGILARAVHDNSPRQAGPFVTVDCTTLPGELVESELFGHERGAFTGAERRVMGKVEYAQGGTLLLDEIGDLSPVAQAKLLRFLQEHRFERVGGRESLSADVRVVCATHRDLRQAVAQGRFREDLYYRVRVVQIDVPPLRERGADEIELLAQHFASTHASRYGRPPPRISSDALALIRSHSWPGNVRELEHRIEAAIVLSPDGAIDEESLAVSRRPNELVTAIGGPSGVVIERGLTLDAAIGRYVAAIVASCDGNKTEAAQVLGISRNRLARLLRASDPAAKPR